jgi:hypothetical protein
MNERIFELAKQAWKEILDETNIDGDTSTMFSADEVVTFEQKFAELIVRECADICEDEDDGSIDTKSVRLAMIRIKKHFGVEE